MCDWRFLNGFPVIYDEVLVPLSLYASRTIDEGLESLVYNSAGELVAHLSDQLSELERRLDAAEASPTVESSARTSESEASNDQPRPDEG